MSGGYFDYKQYHITDIETAIKEVIEENLDGYNEHTLARFKEALYYLRRAAVFAQRIDWLVSGDDGEETFHKRLQEELERIPL